MIKQIDHLGIAVKDLDRQIKFYSDIFGMKFLGIEEVPDQKVRVGIFRLGELRIELLEPTSEDSPIAKFLSQRGEGFHHIAYQVDNLAEDLKRLSERGIQLIDQTPKIGAVGHQIAFLHPRSTFGILTELCQI
ncbi:MAG: methylmalonyl-CoA epimerase [candidate division KSB1 bacterium]|nr:methylmalonyl-CoA epimerase [candidate division KSB1 bacterium]MDZ7335296.1 methylmalonyl-CoA epimerase [candidate division KSB1 bacterium]MDZ7357220.1 methylmalonyl-CoA epimerase [candidate division KSB1 bacterium]MDZ7399091.1 methylmalonyl-CoA epimerase [candidate division KSB1 bacterium]